VFTSLLFGDPAEAEQEGPEMVQLVDPPIDNPDEMALKKFCVIRCGFRFQGLGPRVWVWGSGVRVWGLRVMG
jgi:hypothetical protein